MERGVTEGEVNGKACVDVVLVGQEDSGITDSAWHTRPARQEANANAAAAADADADADARAEMMSLRRVVRTGVQNR